MELRHLRYFVAVAEALHFGRAAGQLHIAQPSLSHQIRQLETELQTTLLRRTKRRVELTDAGRLFLEEARDILGRADRASMMTRRAGHGDEGTLRIGVGYCMDHGLVGRVVSLFTGRRQATRVELQTMSVPAQFTALRDDHLDVGFVRPPIPDITLNSDILTREPLLAALPAKHRAARKSVVELSALGKEPFILPPRDLVPVFHDQVLRACRDAGFVPDAPHEADQLQLVLSMVASGSGVALVPACVRDSGPSGVVFAALRPSPPPLEIAVAWRRDNTSPLLLEFIDAARVVGPQTQTSSAPSSGRGY
jgi:DNA-binding transcriptional LysR family regulator